MTRCITEECIHHHGKNPNGTCRVEKVPPSIGNTGGWRDVMSGIACWSECWHPDRMQRRQSVDDARLFE